MTDTRELVERIAEAEGHTPGPWMPDLDIDDTLRAFDGSPICVMADHNDTEANARLIALAPEMAAEIVRLHRPGDDDSAAVTFWGKRDLRIVLTRALAELDKYYEAQP